MQRSLSSFRQALRVTIRSHSLDGWMAFHSSASYLFSGALNLSPVSFKAPGVAHDPAVAPLSPRCSDPMIYRSWMKVHLSMSANLAPATLRYFFMLDAAKFT